MVAIREERGMKKESQEELKGEKRNMELKERERDRRRKERKGKSGGNDEDKE